jgi:hypothetical protein
MVFLEAASKVTQHFGPEPLNPRYATEFNEEFEQPVLTPRRVNLLYQAQML